MDYNELVTKLNTDVDLSPEEIKACTSLQMLCMKARVRCKCTTIKREHSSAVCTTCGRDLGWYCPDSPDNVCHYFSDESELGDRVVLLANGKEHILPPNHNAEYETADQCIFCRKPNERK